MPKITAEQKQRSRDLQFYEKQCLAEVDKYNRDNDEDWTVGDIRENAKVSGTPKILTHVSFEDFLDDKYPERVAKRNRRAAQREMRENFLSLPLRERLKVNAVSELTLLIRQHGENLAQLEAEFELEIEDESGMGLF